MTARRHLTFRQGDLSEYLASYLMGSLGLVTAVPRQEDVGIDFHCSIADGDDGAVTFGYPFLLQTKSTTNADVRYEKIKSDDDWLTHEIEFLFKQELPVLLGVVDKDSVTISIYSCAPIWFLILESPQCAEFELVPNLTIRDGGVGRPEKIPLKDSSKYPAKISDGYKYRVHLGPPLVTLSGLESQDKVTVSARRELLRRAVFFDQLNITYFRLRVPHFHWFAHIRTNIGQDPAYYYSAAMDSQSHVDTIFASLAPGIISLALLAEHKKDIAAIAELIPMVARIPPRLLAAGIKAGMPSFFPSPGV